VAAELSEGRVKETNITLTPVHGGRFEIYVNDQKVYDRLEAGDGDMYRGLGAMRKVRKVLLEALETEVAQPH
jgi:predicted Rdx family selenoprotein